MTPATRRPPARFWVAGISLAIFLALVLPTLTRQGVAWDEQVDLDIARSYGSTGDGWFSGSGFDASQSRLPMYLGGIVFALLGRDSLLAGRVLSVVMAGLTLLGVVVLGRRTLGEWRGELATLLLATSPFYLSFARVAFTESDIYVTCFLVAFLISLEGLLRERHLGWTLACGVTLGLAVSSKLTAAVFVLLALAAPAFARGRWEDSPRAPLDRRDRRVILLGMVLLVAGLVTAWWWGCLRVLVYGQKPVTATWFPLALLWLGLGVWIWRRRGARFGALGVGPFIAAYAGATFLLVPPVHLTEPDLLLGMAKRVFRDFLEGSGNPGEFAVFYATCLLFKSSPILGSVLLAAPVAALLQWRRRQEVRLLLSALGLYGLFLLGLPLAQTFYLMPLLPILALLAADQVCRLAAQRAVPVVAAVSLGFALLALDVARCYPDFNLNGYQYLGARRLAGRATLGYRSVAQVTTDGTEQSLRWVAEHAEPGSTVVTYVLASHIVRAVCPKPAFRLENGLRVSPEVLSGTDYVVVTIGATLFDDRGVPPKGGAVFEIPYDEERLHRDFFQVLSVPRAFGLEVAGVWKRRPSGPS